MLNEDRPKEMSRRQFLTTVGKIGGSAALFSVMGTMGLLSPQTLKAAAFTPPGKSDLALTSRNGKKVVILGAGIAGLTAAYELGEAGYDCVILEARARSGGRIWSVRRGTTVTEIGAAKQVARFAPGLYLNAGPMRVPQFHVTMEYCRKFGIPVEPYNNVNDNAYFYGENIGALSGQKIRKRAAKADIRGYVAEMLAKAVDQKALDLPLTAEEKEKLVTYLKIEGDLNADLFYKGSSRGGYKEEPGGRLDAGVIRDPFDLKAILNTGFGNFFSSEYTYDQQMIMFHPVGGMDAISDAFEKRLGNRIKHHAEVKEIRQSDSGVRIVYTDLQTGQDQEVTGDYCICTIPLSVLKDIPADFSPAMSRAIRSTDYDSSGKIGLQFGRRFWEEDENIYGGSTLTNLDILGIFYPPTEYLSKKGILLGYYNYGPNADKLGNMTFQERENHALKQGAKIHPQYYKEFETSFSVNWKKIKYSLGGWASYTEEDRKTHYPLLCKPDRRIYLAGEHVSYLLGWIAGGIESARLVVTDIHQRVMKA
ncbi:flavin monoamine oxidase family protein [Paenibacillus sp. GCM10012307]|uniref:FAD-dependent oxidoreductase n=1 Tax=Paenibacillus roseus TaxID=2798579 RepID=A0A934J995_9BACL|nr:flavin monoamine oxidase family protein [Paenibacillus roseus]MBJ6363918.1 FAD-dependent oxidoreductase [Paenibacillus roseus]